jgi:hypothetical protein
VPWLVDPRWYIQSTHSIPLNSGLWEWRTISGMRPVLAGTPTESPGVSWALLEMANLGPDSYWGTKPVFTSLNR